MKRKNLAALSGFATALLMSVALTASGQIQNDSNIANVVGGSSAIRWDVSAPNTGGTLTITFPDGRSVRKTVKSGASPQISLGEQYFESLPDGTYVYELQLAPPMSAAQREALQKARGKDDDPENERTARKRSTISPLTQSGSFTVLNGSIILPGAVEPQQRTAAKTSRASQPTLMSPFRRMLNHRSSFLPDVVTADDSIIQGSECVGLDCVSGEVFGFDTIRLKENNDRLQFDDTSTSAGFPTNNWQIRANSSASGGESFLGIVDQGATGNSETGTIVFQVTAGASANSLRVASNSKIGLRTATPVLDVHMNTSDTPAMRMEQNNTGGFTAQTWDVAGNEANFFVRDVTSGSRLPFRIRPGAPTSSVDISASGSVGVGTASPGFALDVQQNTGNNATGTVIRLKGNLTGTNDNTQIRFTGKTNGDLFTIGTDVSTNNGSRNFQIFDLVAAAPRLTVDSNGNVGIATTTPDQKLSVQGDADKSAGGTSWGVFSDERLKDIKGSYSRGLSAVMGLQPVRFSYKKDNALKLQTDSENIGFSAQALQKLVPEAVTKSPSGYLVVHSDAVLWAMLNAIKEQQAEIQQLKGQIQKLRTVHRRRHR